MSTPKKPDHFAHTLLRRSHSPLTAQRIFTDDVNRRPLIIRPTSPPPTGAKDARDKRRERREQKKAVKKEKASGKPRPLSAKQKRALSLCEIPKSEQKYAIYEPLHELWVKYIRQVLGVEGEHKFVTKASAGPLICSADLHGAKVEVVRSRCPSRVGLRGIVVKDTMFTFEIITERGEAKTVPKEQSIFRIAVRLQDEPKLGDGVWKRLEPLVFEIHGEQFKNRAPERARRQFKVHLYKHL